MPSVTVDSKASKDYSWRLIPTTFISLGWPRLLNSSKYSSSLCAYLSTYTCLAICEACLVCHGASAYSTSYLARLWTPTLKTI